MIRKCETCLYEWGSDTVYKKGTSTKCPKCGAEVPGVG